MSYSNMQHNVTPIDMLPELADLDTGINMLPADQATKYAKFIRPKHQMAPMAGMTSNIREPEFIKDNFEYVQPNERMPANSPSCLDCAEHIQSCPLCSKFYNNDKTLYIIAILVLSLICILLLKRVLDV
jgi:hypothetical protein